LAIGAVKKLRRRSSLPPESLELLAKFRQNGHFEARPAHFIPFSLPGGKAVIANDNFANQPNIRLRRARSLILQRVLEQPAIQRIMSAVECIYKMLARQGTNRRIESGLKGCSFHCIEAKDAALRQDRLSRRDLLR
jgi:hypothetical protein